jgi:ABC-type transporter Mla subunit MlaD
MSTSQPLRHVREIVGVFVLVTLALALAAVMFIGRGRAVFESRATVFVTFPAARAAVLRPGVAVRLTGEAVGRVVVVTRHGEIIRTRLEILQAARDVLRNDAKATLRVPLAGLVGELGIELDPGGETEPWPDGRTLVGEAQGDPADKVREAVEQLRTQVPLILARTQSILDRTDGILGEVQRAHTAENADRLVRTLERLARVAEKEEALVHVARVLSELEQLIRGIREGKGSIGRLVTDPTLYDRTALLLEDLHGSWSRIDGLVVASSRLADRASELAEGARGRKQDLESLFGQVQLLVLQANRALDKVNESWLLGGEPQAPLRPAPPAVLDLPWSAAAPAGTPALPPTDGPAPEGKP